MDGFLEWPEAGSRSDSVAIGEYKEGLKWPIKKTAGVVEGEETRALLIERGNEWRDKAEELAAATKERLSSAAFESRRAASQVRGGSFNDFDLDLDEL